MVYILIKYVPIWENIKIIGGGNKKKRRKAEKGGKKISYVNM